MNERRPFGMGGNQRVELLALLIPLVQLFKLRQVYPDHDVKRIGTELLGTTAERNEIAIQQIEQCVFVGVLRAG